MLRYRSKRAFTVQDYVDKVANRAEPTAEEGARGGDLQRVKSSLHELTQLALAGRANFQNVHVMRDAHFSDFFRKMTLELNGERRTVVEGAHLLGWSFSQAVLHPLPLGQEYPPGSLLVMQNGATSYCADVPDEVPSHLRPEIFLHASSLGRIEASKFLDPQALQAALQNLIHPS